MSFQTQALRVREEHPLQQGLRHKSIQTLAPEQKCQRRTSITTRIKTWCTLCIEILCTPVREEHPLQQGLRPPHHIAMMWGIEVREEHPLQQGLRRLL